MSSSFNQWILLALRMASPSFFQSIFLRQILPTRQTHPHAYLFAIYLAGPLDIKEHITQIPPLHQSTRQSPMRSYGIGGNVVTPTWVDVSATSPLSDVYEMLIS